MIPNVEAGTREAGRDVSEIDIMAAPIIVTGRTAAELEEERKLLKRRVSFYASTRTYSPVFEVHGWGEIGERLHQLSLENRWDDMVKLIPDEMAEAFGTVAPIEEIGPRLRERWSGILTSLNFPTDFPLDAPEDEKRTREIVQLLQSDTSSP